MSYVCSYVHVNFRSSLLTSTTILLDVWITSIYHLGEKLYLYNRVMNTPSAYHSYSIWNSLFIITSICNYSLLGFRTILSLYFIAFTSPSRISSQN